MFNQLWSHRPLYTCMYWTATGWTLIHAQISAYTCMDGCLLTRVDRCLCMHGQVLVHEWTGA